MLKWTGQLGCLWAGLVLATALAGDSPGLLKPNVLCVAAVDDAGNVVKDLQPGDLRVVDDGVPQQITWMNPNQAGQCAQLVVLFDFTDLSFSERSIAVKQLRSSLDGAPAAAPVYVYFLLGKHDIEPVCRVPGEIRAEPRLRELAAQFNQDRIRVYALNPFSCSGGMASSMFRGPRIAGGAAGTEAGIDVLAEGPGGIVFSGMTLTDAARQPRADAAFGYVLEYRPPAVRESKRSYHTIRVSSMRKGIQIRTQQIYFPRLELSN